MAKMGDNRMIGLALGGGAVLGAAHAGVLRAFEDHQIKIKCLAGTSIGSLVAVLYAFGKSWKEISAIAEGLKWLDITEVSFSKFGLLSNEKLGDLIRKEIGDVDLNEAKIPVAVVATDIANGEKVVLSSGNAAEAVMASTCIPGIFIPSEIEGKMLVDGGIAENVPVTVVRDLGAEFAIGVDLTICHKPRRPQNIFEVILNTFDFTIRTATRIQTRDADLIISPDLSTYNMMETDQVPELIRKGYEDAKAALKEMN